MKQLLQEHMTLAAEAKKDDPEAFGIGRKKEFRRRVIFEEVTSDGRLIEYHVTKGWRVVTPARRRRAHR